MAQPEIMPLVTCSTALILMLLGMLFYRPAPKNYSALEDDQELVGRLARLERILQLFNFCAFIGSSVSAYLVESPAFGLISAIWLVMGLVVPWFNSSKSYRAGGHYIYWLAGSLNLFCLVYWSGHHVAKSGARVEMLGLPVSACVGLTEIIYLGFWSGRTSSDVSQNVQVCNLDFGRVGSVTVFQHVLFFCKQFDEEGKS